MIQIVAVDDKISRTAFIDFPHELYREDSNYVPELFIAQRDLLTQGKYPFFKHSTLQTFLAYNGKKVVGRMAAIKNNSYNTIKNVSDGFFGFFDCINHQETETVTYAEASWTLDHNELINKPTEQVGEKLYRNYRILEKTI